MKVRVQNRIQNFTDHKTQKIYDGIYNKVDNDIDSWIDYADQFRNETNTDSITKAACIYLSLAQKEIKNEKYDITTLYHFAGHQFRRIDQLNRAAQAYENAAICEYNKSIENQYKYNEKAMLMALRSAGRAKNLYADIGGFEESDRSHVIQQDLKYMYYKNTRKLKFYLILWRVLTNYGTSPKRWFFSFSLTTLAFTIIYQFLLLVPGTLLIEHGFFTVPILTPFYFTLVTSTTLGYGNISPANWYAQVICLMNFIMGWMLLGTGITFFARK